MDNELLIAVGALVTALGTLGINAYNARHTARKDEIIELRRTVEALRKEAEGVRDRYEAEIKLLRQEIAELRGYNQKLTEENDALRAEIRRQQAGSKT